jgi:histidinol phosphatase-like PHP family hydrolase
MHHIEFDRKKGRLIIRYEGRVTVREYFQVIEELASMEEMRDGLDGMAIFLGTEVDVDPEDVRAIVDELRGKLDFAGRRWAFVIEEPRQVAIGLLYQMAAQGVHEVEIFATVEAATAWLDDRTRDRA